MRTFLLVYMVAYGLVAVAGFAAYVFLVPRKEKTSDMPGGTLLDALLIIVGFVGMLLLWLGFKPAPLRDGWKVVSVALLFLQFFLNLRARSRHLAENPSDEHFLLVRIGDFGLLFVLAPSLAFNLLYAFADDV